ncbi:MAG: IclR family transcriptional regulator [Moraxella sp.]|nr:IclR family transcriptional regulator [Moraxella sp.]
MPNHVLRTIHAAEQSDDRKFITALARGLLVLSAVGDDVSGLSHQEICQASGLPKATVSRLIYTLMQTGFLSMVGDRYRLGVASLLLGQHADTHHSLAVRAKPLMQDFAKMYQVSVSLATESMGEMVYVESVRSPAKLTVQLSVGSRLPIATTSVGRALFAVSDDKHRQALLQDLASHQPNINLQQARTLLEQHATSYHAQGYSISNGEFSPDIMAVAVAVYNPLAKRHTHAINASVPASTWQQADFVDFICDKLQRLAVQIGGG